MINGSLVQFYPILFTTKGTVKCCMCKKKRPGKKSTIIRVGTTIIPFISAKLLNARCEVKLPKKNNIEPRLVLKHVL